MLDPTVLRLYNKIAKSLPTVETDPGSTIEGSIDYPQALSSIDARVYRTSSPTGIDRYPADSANLSSTGVFQYEASNRELTFVVDTNELNAPTGAIAGEMYGVKIIGQCTGINPQRHVSDFIIKISGDFKG